VEKSTRVAAAVKRLLTALDIDIHDPNYRDTPKRYAEWLMTHFPSDAEFVDRLDDLSTATFPSDYNGLVVQTKIQADGLCPHHLLPVRYKVAVGYLPEDQAIGLSKLTRITQLCFTKAGLQEDLTELLAAALQAALNTKDVAVVVQGVHMCMSVRGVKAHEGETTTSAMTGKFMRNEGGIKEEFLLLIKNGGN
jgi:GTP cyclohydrolase IA